MGLFHEYSLSCFLLVSRPNRYLLYDLVKYIYGTAHRPFVPYPLPRPLYQYVLYCIFRATATKACCQARQNRGLIVDR